MKRVPLALWMVGVVVGVAAAAVSYTDGLLAASNLLLTGALVLATVLLVLEGRALREAQFAPAIAVELVQSSASTHVLNLVVRNFGAGSAYDVTFDLDGDLKLLRGRLSDEPVLVQGLRFLAPGGRYEVVAADRKLLDENPAADDREVRRVRLSTHYASSTGRRYASESYLELLPLRFAVPPLEAIKQDVKRIADALAKRS
jgi:hypothetical protein